MAPVIANPSPPTAIAGAGPHPRTTCRSSWWLLVCFGVTVFLISLVLSVAVRPWINLSWWRTFRRCVSIASALSLWFFITCVERRSIRSYGFSTPRAGRRQFLFGLLLGAGALGIMLGVGMLTGACRIQISSDRMRLWGTLISFLPIAGLVALLEELVFRGFILQQLRSCSTALAVIVSSTLYAVVHWKSAPMELVSWTELGGLALLGGVLAVSYLRTGQLYLSIGLHAVLAYGARVNKLLIEFADPSMGWLVGTSRLVNGIVNWLALLGVGLVILWWTRSSPDGGGKRHAQT